MTSRSKPKTAPVIKPVDEAAAKRHAKMLNVASKVYGKELIAYPGARTITPGKMLEAAQKLRDSQIHQYPILPGAITIFQQLASNREWKVSGTPRAASRAVEWFNLAQVLSPTGYLYTGFEGFLKRRALDWLIVGRTAFGVRRGKDSPLEYIDPTELRFRRKKPQISTHIEPIKDSENVWRYVIDATDFRNDELFLDHAIPLGGRDLFISPIANVLPAATLAYLLREFDTASLDGRRIRDIILTNNNNLTDALKEAILSLINLYAGADPSDVGVQVVTLSGNTGMAVKDMFARLGLANIPDAFDRKDFRFGYVNEISAATGLALRQFWNEEVTTNKALEEVQEQRQQAKGPSAYVRSEQRLINNSRVLQRFGRTTRFGFFEEVDASSQLINAQVLKLTGEALQTISSVFGGTISMDGYMAWMQSIGILPAELEIITSAAGLPSTSTSTNADVQPGDATQVPTDGEKIVNGNPPASELDTAKSLEEMMDYGEVTINQNGTIIEKRSKVFSIVKAILTEKTMPTTVKEADYDQSLGQARSQTLTKLKYWIDFEYEELNTHINTSKLYEPSKLLDLCVRLKANKPENLTEEDHAKIEYIVDMVSAELVNE